MHPFSKLLGVDPRVMQRRVDFVPPVQAKSQAPANTLFEYDGQIFDLANLNIDVNTPADVIKAKNEMFPVGSNSAILRGVPLVDGLPYKMPSTEELEQNNRFRKAVGMPEVGPETYVENKIAAEMEKRRVMAEYRALPRSQRTNYL